MDAAREQFIENYVFMYVRVRKINIVNRIISCNYRKGNVNILGYFKKNIDRGYSLEIYRWNLLFHRSLAREVLSRVFQYVKRHFAGEESEICGFARDSLSRVGQGK